MKSNSSSQTMNLTPRQMRTSSLFGNLFKRTLDNDMIVFDDVWLGQSGVQQQLEHEGYQLRWVSTNKLELNLADGWEYVTVAHYIYWRRRVRRRSEGRIQYLIKRGRSFRDRGSP